MLEYLRSIGRLRNARKYSADYQKKLDNVPIRQTNSREYSKKRHES